MNKHEEQASEAARAFEIHMDAESDMLLGSISGKILDGNKSLALTLMKAYAQLNEAKVLWVKGLGHLTIKQMSNIAEMSEKTAGEEILF